MVASTSKGYVPTRSGKTPSVSNSTYRLSFWSLRPPLQFSQGNQILITFPILHRYIRVRVSLLAILEESLRPADVDNNHQLSLMYRVSMHHSSLVDTVISFLKIAV